MIQQLKERWKDAGESVDYFAMVGDQIPVYGDCDDDCEDDCYLAHQVGERSATWTERSRVWTFLWTMKNALVCRIFGHEMIGDDWATPDTGGMAGFCGRGCGWGFRVSLY